MSDQPESGPFTRSRRFALVAAVAVVALIAAGVWWWRSLSYESTDDAQIDAHVTPMAARVGGTVAKVLVVDNQVVEPGAVLVELDQTDYTVALEKARAELADAEAAALAAQSHVPITSTAATSQVTTAQSGTERARSGVEASQREIDVAKARRAAAAARVREAETNLAKTARDLERYRGLLAKDEVSQQQFDSASAAVEAQRAAVDTARASLAEADASIGMAESRLGQAEAAELQARSELRGVQTAPQQVTATRAQAAAAEARVAQMKAAVAQAELNLAYTIVKAPARGVVAKRSLNPGQVVQPGQPLLALVQTDEVWVTANFKETQLESMRPGQRVDIEVDAYPGKTFTGSIASLAPATGARFSLLPPENATGNFVKVVQRVPVKIALDPGQDPEHLLRPGMSVVPTVYLR
jgi:membrane fusion protein (multidrug efflux system)